MGFGKAAKRQDGEMKKSLAMLVLLTLIFGGCSTPPAERADAPGEEQAADREAAGDDGSEVGEDNESDTDEAADPNEKKPARRADLDPERTAARLTRIHEAFRTQLSEWQANGSQRGAGGWGDLQLLGLEQQVTMRRLARHPEFADKVIPLLEGRLRFQATSNVKAAQGLLKLTTPVKPPIPDYPITRAELPHKLKKYYDIAEERFDVPWYILASVNFIETKFGRFQGPSSAGAEGPMQFLPATWDAYGRGDVHEPYNAIMGAARYLKASGAPDRMRDALYAYNHSDAYVTAILAYAREMKRSDLNLYDYYFWQVFIRTTKGYKQITGPEL